MNSTIFSYYISISFSYLWCIMLKLKFRNKSIIYYYFMNRSTCKITTTARLTLLTSINMKFAFFFPFFHGVTSLCIELK